MTMPPQQGLGASITLLGEGCRPVVSLSSSVALAFGVGEMVTLAFFAAFLSLAAVGAAVAAAAGGDLLVQGIVFTALAVGGVVLARPPLLRWMHYRYRATPATLSGAQEMIGCTGLVTDPIKGAHLQILSSSPQESISPPHRSSRNV